MLDAGTKFYPKASIQRGGTPLSQKKEGPDSAAEWLTDLPRKRFKKNYFLLWAGQKELGPMGKGKFTP